MNKTKESFPHDDQMQTARCFEVDMTMKEKPFEENPRRHWAELQRGLLEKLVEQLMLEGAIEERLDKTDKLNEWRLYLKIHAILPCKKP